MKLTPITDDIMIEIWVAKNYLKNNPNAPKSLVENAIRHYIFVVDNE